jgi:hypothetical protein
MKKQVAKILLFILFAAVLSSCGPQPQEPVITDNSVERLQNPAAISTMSIVEELIKPEYRGRLAGSEGNEKAGKYLAEVFQSIGLTPLREDSYMHGYMDTVHDPDVSDPQVTLHFKNGTEKRLTYGEDFSMNVGFGDIDERRAVTFDLHSPGIENMVYIAKTVDDLTHQKLRDANANVYVLPRDEKGLVFVPQIAEQDARVFFSYRFICYEGYRGPCRDVHPKYSIAIGKRTVQRSGVYPRKTERPSGGCDRAF